MRPVDGKRPPIDRHVFDSIVARIETPSGPSGDERRALLDDLRDLIERGRYRVEPEAVAEAIVREAGFVIDWWD